MLSAPAQEFLDREAASWEAFDAQVSRVSEDRREAPGLVGDWSLKAVVWHCACWARFAAEHLAVAGETPFADPFDAHPDEHWDAMNVEIAEAASGMSWNDVVTGAGEARSTLRDQVARPGLAAEPITWAADESWIHYDEHGASVKAVADQEG